MNHPAYYHLALTNQQFNPQTQTGTVLVSANTRDIFLNVKFRYGGAPE